MPQAAVSQAPHKQVEIGTRAGQFSGRIPELDGVRALAIWMVLGAHLFFAFPNPASTFAGIPQPLQQLVGHGWLGVDLFFVLSGFLITGILLDSRENPNFAKNFYGRRVLRIFPLYFVSTILMWLFYSNSTRYFLLSLCFLANFDNVFHIHEPHGMGILWSLNVEEHFYFVWPWLVLLLNRRQLAVVAASILALTPILRGICAARGIETYYVSWFRFDGLALGALIAIWVRSRHSNRQNSLKLAIGLLVAGAMITAVGWPFGIMRDGVAGAALRYTQAQSIFGAMMLATLALLNTPYTFFLRSAFARLTGELSYCLYLVHLAVGDAYVYLMKGQRLNPEDWLGLKGALLLRVLVILIGSYSLALLSRKYLERPFLKMKSFFE